MEKDENAKRPQSDEADAPSEPTGQAGSGVLSEGAQPGDMPPETPDAAGGDPSADDSQPDNGQALTPAQPEHPAPSPRREFHFERPIDELYDQKPDDCADESDDGGNPAAEPPARERRHGCLHAMVYAVTITAFSALLTIGILLAACDMFGIFKADQKIDVDIPKGADSAQIAKTLQKDGVIRFGPIFRAYVHFTKAKGFQPGTYTLNSNMGYETIVTTLQDASNNAQLVKVTIPEGKTLRQIGQILESNKVCTSQDFLTQVEAGGFRFSFDSQIPNTSGRFYRYEGYLFPDTYEFYQNSSGKTAAQKMLANFSGKFTADMVQKASSLGFTVDQTVTLASIVQTEAGKTSEMGKIASVFENRLKNGVKDNGGKHFLQSDATIFYVLRGNGTSSTPTSSETAISSAYNTYKVEGLPPGPICNPGLAAIQAVLSPESTNYYYFVSDKSGNYYYSSTYAEHQKAVKKAMKSGGATGTNVVQ